MGFWRWLTGKKEEVTPKVEFKDKDRIEPTLQIVNPGLAIGQLELRGDDLYRWTDYGWKMVCRMPKQSEVKTVHDLPDEAPFNHIYRIDDAVWCWDGGCWVKQGLGGEERPGYMPVRHIRKPISVEPRLQPMRGRLVTPSRQGYSDPHPVDNGGIMTAVMIAQILDTDHDRQGESSQGGSSHISHETSHTQHHDTPSYDIPHSTPSSNSDYGSSDFGGGGFD